MSSHIISNRPTIEDLQKILDRPGPFLTMYVDLTEAHPADEWARWRTEPVDAEHQVLAAAMDEVTADLAGTTADVAGWACIVTGDGSSTIFHSADAPRRTIVRLSALPYLAPILEWAQREIPHLVLSLPPHATEADQVTEVDVVPFAMDVVPRTFRSVSAAVTQTAEMTNESDIPLVSVVGSPSAARAVAARLRDRCAIETVIDVVESDNVDVLADSIVRSVATIGANATVARLREFRFERSHNNVVEGVESTLAAVGGGHGRLLLVHDDPDDARYVDEERMHHVPVFGIVESPVRVVDAAVAAAIATDTDIRIIPDAARGPRGAIGAVLDDQSTVWPRRLADPTTSPEPKLVAA